MTWSCGACGRKRGEGDTVQTVDLALVFKLQRAGKPVEPGEAEACSRACAAVLEEKLRKRLSEL